MTIQEALNRRGISAYRLWKESGVSQATISDLCTGKTQIQKCSAETVYKLSGVLGVTMESLLATAIQEEQERKNRPSFELFKSRTCHRLMERMERGD